MGQMCRKVSGLFIEDLEVRTTPSLMIVTPGIPEAAYANADENAAFMGMSTMAIGETPGDLPTAGEEMTLLGG